MASARGSTMTCGRSMWAAMKSASTTLHSRLRRHSTRLRRAHGFAAKE